MKLKKNASVAQLDRVLDYESSGCRPVSHQGGFESYRVYKMYYVYILYSRNYNRTYTGQTNNIEKRLLQHNKGRNKSTKPYIPWEIIHLEKYTTREESVAREKYLKSKAGSIFIREKYF